MATDTVLVNSIIGAGTFIKGHIDVLGLLRIDGDFSGSIKTSDRVILGRTGRADCTIDAATVVIGGAFRGTVYASDKVIALESAIILGNIFTPRLIAESGVLLDGAVHVRKTGETKEVVEIGTKGTERAAQVKPTKRRIPKRSGSKQRHYEVH